MKLATRMEQIPAYVFASVASRIREKEARGVQVINLGAGSPDMPPPSWIVEEMSEAAHSAAAHRYPGYTGTVALRRAWAHYYSTRFGVELDPEREVLPLIGSKEGIAHMALALISPGDLVLVPDPGYPTYGIGTILAGGTPYPMPLYEENDFLPDLDALPAEISERAVAMWLNYPNNPTGATAPLSFYEKVVDFARRHGIAVLSDNPYADVCYDGYRAGSFLEAEGAKEVGIEINSVSKTYNMAGWRVGAAVGNATLINALMRVKSNVDTGIFLPLQVGAAAALEGEQAWIEERNAIYQRRRDIVVEGMRVAGFTVTPPRAALYVWARVPEGADAATLANRFLEEAAVWITPGEAFGEAGKSYMRVALCAPEAELSEAMARVARVMTTT